MIAQVLTSNDQNDFSKSRLFLSHVIQICRVFNTSQKGALSLMESIIRQTQRKPEIIRKQKIGGCSLFKYLVAREDDLCYVFLETLFFLESVK